MEYRKEDAELATTPALERENTLELKASMNGHLMEPIEAAWLLWGKRRFLIWLTVAGLALAAPVAVLLPKGDTASTRLVAPGYGPKSALRPALPALGGGGNGAGGGRSV